MDDNSVNDPKLFGIGLVPNEENRRRIISTQQETRKWGNWQGNLNETDSWPHLSLLHANVLDAEEVIARVTDLLDGRAKVVATVTGAEYVERGWYFVNFGHSEEIREMHEIAFDGLKDLIRPGVIKDRASFEAYSSTERENYLNFGYRYILKDYAPHITLGRTISSQRSFDHDKIINLMKSRLLGVVQFDELVVFEIGKNGTMLRKLWQKILP